MPGKKAAKKKAAPKAKAMKPKSRPKGRTYVCVPCGRELVITRQGMAASILLCCGEAMQEKK